MWKNGQNEAEHSTWMQLLTARPFTDGEANCPYVEPSGQKTKQSEVAGEYVRWKRTATK